MTTQRLERNRDSAARTTQDLPKGRRQELRDRYGLSLPDTVPVAPDPTRRPTALPLDEAGTSLTRADLHEQLVQSSQPFAQICRHLAETEAQITVHPEMIAGDDQDAFLLA